MRKKLSDQELQDRINVVVDPDAEPVDVDAAVAKFLLAYVRQQSRSSPETSAADTASSSIPPETERHSR